MFSSTSLRSLRPALIASAGVVVLAALLALGGPISTSEARTTAASATDTRPDAWLAGLKGKHRQLFDATAPAGGIPLIHVLNYYDTYNKAFNTSDRDVNAVLTFYGSTTFHGLTDAMWSKYRLGEFLGEKDAKGVAFTENPWRVAPTIMGMSLPQASIESLQKRGATFILCNNALTILSGLVANARGADPAAVYADMKANILPNVTLVPGMVVAIEQAQVAGLSYHRQ